MTWTVILASILVAYVAIGLAFAVMTHLLFRGDVTLGEYLYVITAWPRAFLP